MTIRIHHTQHKQAAKYGATLEVVTDGGVEFVVATLKDGRKLAGANAADAIALLIDQTGGAKKLRAVKSAKKAKRRAHKADAEDDEEEDADEDSGKSVIKMKYKRQYKPFKAKCGDELSMLITKHLSFKDEDGKTRLDQDKLVRFAKANDVWMTGYKDLNGGMRRLNIGNRLRGKVRKGHKVVWAS